MESLGVSHQETNRSSLSTFSRRLSTGRRDSLRTLRASMAESIRHNFRQSLELPDQPEEEKVRHVKEEIVQGRFPENGTDLPRPLPLSRDRIPLWLKTLNTIVMITVFISSLTIGIEVDSRDPEFLDMVWWTDAVCTGIFGLELFFKLHMLRRGYFRDYWNLIDFALVWVSVVDRLVGWLGSSWAPVLLLRVLRLVRITRILRFFRIFQELWFIITGLAIAMKAMMWVMTLLLIVLYVFALLCVMVVRDEADDKYPGADENIETLWTSFNPYEYFASVPDSMATLFSLVVMADFTSFARPIYQRQFFFYFVFLVFILLTTFALLNMLVGVIVESTMQASKCLDHDKRLLLETTMMQQMVRLTKALDPDDNGVITIEELDDALTGNNPEALKLMNELGFPPGFDAHELHILLGSGDNQVSAEIFRKNAVRLVSTVDNPFEWHCMVLLKMNEISARLIRFESGLATNSSSLLGPGLAAGAVANGGGDGAGPRYRAKPRFQSACGNDGGGPPPKVDGRTPMSSGAASEGQVALKRAVSEPPPLPPPLDLASRMLRDSAAFAAEEVCKAGEALVWKVQQETSAAQQREQEMLETAWEAARQALWQDVPRLTQALGKQLGGTPGGTWLTQGARSSSSFHKGNEAGEEVPRLWACAQASSSPPPAEPCGAENGARPADAPRAWPARAEGGATGCALGIQVAAAQGAEPQSQAKVSRVVPGPAHVHA